MQDLKQTRLSHQERQVPMKLVLTIMTLVAMLERQVASWLQLSMTLKTAVAAL